MSARPSLTRREGRCPSGSAPGTAPPPALSLTPRKPPSFALCRLPPPRCELLRRVGERAPLTNGGSARPPHAAWGARVGVTAAPAGAGA